MTTPLPDADPRIDLYIDGLLEGDDLAAFERDLADSRDLQAQLESQAHIDDSLKDLFAYDPARAVMPTAPDVIGRVDANTMPASPVVVRGHAASQVLRLRRYAMAAAVLLAFAGGWAAYVNLTTPTIENLLAPATVYAMVDKPEFECKDDAEFAAVVKKRLGQPLVLAKSPGITALGWAYSDDYNGKIVGSKTMVLINKVDDAKVLVFMDRTRDDRTLDLPAESGLNLFRREIGSLVLYEVTPLAESRVIYQLKIPEK